MKYYKTQLKKRIYFDISRYSKLFSVDFLDQANKLDFLFVKTMKEISKLPYKMNLREYYETCNTLTNSCQRYGSDMPLPPSKIYFFQFYCLVYKSGISS